MKQRLRREVARFCARDDRLWKRPVVEMLSELHEEGTRAVFFGGTLRSLLVSRLFASRPGRPRDIDIVIGGSSIDVIRQRFQERVIRDTRFGGLQLRNVDWQFDVWPLGKTWAFTRDSVDNPQFALLPATTFFNLEAIAIDVWTTPGKSREIYSGDDQFFDGVLSRTLEINREENPFPELCVVRGLILAASLDFQIGPHLASYIARNGQNLTVQDLEDVQKKHYSKRRQDGVTLKEWIDFVTVEHASSSQKPVTLPLSRQRRLWVESDNCESIRIHGLGQ